MTRRSVVLVVLVVLVVAVALLLTWPPTTQEAGHDDPADGNVQVRDVSVQQTDSSYALKSVHAVVQGDRAFLRVRIDWPDESHDAGASHPVPALSGTVLHGEPYAGTTATCGTPADPPDAQSPSGSTAPVCWYRRRSSRSSCGTERQDPALQPGQPT